MKKIIVTVLAALMLLSCSKKTSLYEFEGDYTVDQNTVIILNGNEVNLSDYENAEINIKVLDGNNCNITLTNFISGQPEVTVPGTLTAGGSKSASGAAFSGSQNTSDRNVSIEGVTAESTIASISINEKITVEGIPGTWTLNSASVTFFHPDLSVIDLDTLAEGLVIPVDDIVEMINGILAGQIQDSDNQTVIRLTEDGYFNEAPVCYYIRPAESTLYIFLRKSTVEMLAERIKEDPDIMGLISMLGFSSLIDNPQSMNIPLQYTTTGERLTLTATQDLLDPYEAMLSQPIAVIKALLIQYLTYDLILDLSVDFPVISTIITEENFPLFKEIVLDTFDTVTDGQSEYSVTVGFQS